jgi:hypothetical protein
MDVLIVFCLIMLAIPESNRRAFGAGFIAVISAAALSWITFYVFWREFLRAKCHMLVWEYRSTGNSNELVEFFNHFRFTKITNHAILRSVFVYLPLFEAFAEFECVPPEPIRVQFEQLNRQWWNIYWQVKRRRRANAIVEND